MSQGTLHQMIPVFSIRDQIWITPSTSSRSSLCGWVLISSASTVTQHKKRKHGNNQLGRSRNSTTTCEPDTNLAQLWGDLISWVKMYFCWGLDKISFNDWLGLPRHDLQLLLLSFVCLYTLIILNVVRESIYVCEYFVCRYVLSSHCFGFFTLFWRDTLAVSNRYVSGICERRWPLKECRPYHIMRFQSHQSLRLAERSTTKQSFGRQKNLAAKQKLRKLQSLQWEI